MAWEVSTAAVQDGDPILVYYRDALAERIREHFEHIDRVVCFWRRAGQWLPTPFAIRMPKSPKDRATAVPETGAAQLVELAFNFARDNDARHLKFEGYGTSKREDTAKILFSLRAEPLSEPELDDNKRKTENAAIDAASVLSDTVTRMGAQLDASFSRELRAVDKVIEMARDNSANTQAAIYGLAFAREMKRDEHEHTERMEEMRSNSKATEQVIETLGKPFASAFEKLLAKAFGVDEAAFNAKTFAGRLTAIVHACPEPALQRCKEIVGDDAWEVLKAMSKTESDEAFTAQGRKFVELLGPDPTAKFREIAGALGQGPAAALLRLIADAGIVEE